MALADEGQVRQAEVALATARAEDICNALRNSRNAFIGHTLIGECRQGVPVLDLIEYVGTLESIAESLYDGVYGRRPDFDTHIGTWLDISTAWFEHMLPDRNE
jgi:hypothetical protein